METKEKITTLALSILTIATIVLSAGLINQKNVYACEETNVALICESLSKINSDGIQTRCYFNNEKNISTYKVCNSGWKKYESNTPKIISNFNATNNLNISDYLCNNNTFIKECINDKGDVIIRVKS